MENLGKLCYTVALVIISMITGAFVFIKLWQWFIITSFQATPITIPQALGIMLFVGYLKPKAKTEDEKITIKKLTESFFETLLQGVFALLIGWIITLFI